LGMRGLGPSELPSGGAADKGGSGGPLLDSGLPNRRYSLRMLDSGSARVARHAGRRLAARDTMASTMATTP